LPRPKNKIREEAKKQGVKRYFDPRPCPQGHVAERLTSCGICVVCNNEKTKRLYHTNSKVRGTIKAASRRQKERVGNTKWYHENKEKAAIQNKTWRENNKEEFDIYCKEWRQTNRDKLAKNSAAYRSQKIQATPSWADLGAIQQVYTEAQRLSDKTGVKHTVDHYYPLVSDVMCGLHVENNLQILTLSKNSSKRNTIPE
jgi:hypothetical protein